MAGFLVITSLQLIKRYGAYVFCFTNTGKQGCASVEVYPQRSRWAQLSLTLAICKQ